MDLTVNQWLGEFDPHTRSQFVGALCNGSTTDFDSVSLGSIPSAPASLRIVTANINNNTTLEK